MKTPRILIIAGAAGVRNTLAEIITSDGQLSLQATAADPFIAARHIADEIPNAIVLDLETPRMSGLSFLRKVMAQCPIPVVVFSTQVKEGGPELKAVMDAGAMDFLPVPEERTRDYLMASAALLLAKVKAAARLRVSEESEWTGPDVQPKLSADVILPPRPRWATVARTERVICMGASTGGTDSLQVVLGMMPPDCPGLLVVIHMPEMFTRTYADRLNGLCRIHVREAQHGDPVRAGQALLAPGDRHLLLARRGDRYVAELNDGPAVSRHRPSVDVLFRSASRSAGSNAIGVIMTGMGDDGAHGLLEMRQAGANTIAEHESTCVVFGMPKEAIRLGAAESVVPLPKIAEKVTSRCARRPGASF
ncbi:MAG: chemotaxis response regulator protein-glutamate methylesterase [Magnetococcales bacterium]|nr:chemotaxis response regulator protein-glutamate methylesterase [Magnetococcales bacterium]